MYESRFIYLFELKTEKSNKILLFSRCFLMCVLKARRLMNDVIRYSLFSIHIYTWAHIHNNTSKQGNIILYRQRIFQRRKIRSSIYIHKHMHIYNFSNSIRSRVKVYEFRAEINLKPFLYVIGMIWCSLVYTFQKI